MRGYYNFKVIILLCFLPLSTIGKENDVYIKWWGHYIYPIGCTTGVVRLAGSSYTNRGRVEICVNNAWGTVCRHSFDINDARVICHQLGYPSGNIYQ